MRFDLLRLFRTKGKPSRDAIEADFGSPDRAARELTLKASFGGAPAQPVELFDMNIHGARVIAPFHFAPSEADGQPVRLDIRHESRQWAVQAHSRVTQLNRWSDDKVMLELEFTQLGALYAQLDNALGRYFNRRGEDRVAPAEGERIGVRLARGPHRVRGLASDLSSTGLCTRAPLVQAAVFRLGEHVQASIDLPGSAEEIEVSGTVRHGYRDGEDVHLGIEFDRGATHGMARRRTEYLKYIERRREAEAHEPGPARRPA